MLRLRATPLLTTVISVQSSRRNSNIHTSWHQAVNVFTISSIVGRLEGMEFQQRWMRFHMLSAILGFSNRWGRFPFARSRIIWISLIPWKGTVSKNVWLFIRHSIWRKIKQGWDTPSNKGSQKRKCQFSLFYFCAAPCDLRSILRSQTDCTLCTYRITLVRRNLKKELL